VKTVSAAEAVAEIRSGDQVYLHGAAATPSVLLDALVARSSRREGRRLHLL
jgi:4-hydroxybutyrate CoA-transferase